MQTWSSFTTKGTTMSDWKGDSIEITTQAAQDRENAGVTCLMSWATAMMGCNPFKNRTRIGDFAVYEDSPNSSQTRTERVAESKEELYAWLDSEASKTLFSPEGVLEGTGEGDTLRHGAHVLDDLLSEMNTGQIVCLEEIFYGIFKANRGE